MSSRASQERKNATTKTIGSLHIKAHLLKYSMSDAKQAKKHSQMQTKHPPSSFACAALASMRKACKMATSNEPKQTDPNDVVVVRKKALLTAELQQQLASDGSNHQLPTIPATVTWIDPYMKKKGNQ
jgi:hypothetical protein